jgi:hypothetical protein
MSSTATATTYHHHQLDTYLALLKATVTTMTECQAPNGTTKSNNITTYLSNP